MYYLASPSNHTAPDSGDQTTELGQFIYVDTPGMHSDGKRAMNRYMNRAAAASVDDVDVVVFVIDGMKWTEEDDRVLKNCRTPVNRSFW